MELTIVIVALIAFVGFRQWLKHQRRVMIHRGAVPAGPPVDRHRTGNDRCLAFDCLCGREKERQLRASKDIYMKKMLPGSLAVKTLVRFNFLIGRCSTSRRSSTQKKLTRFESS